ncbi:MAG: hypothetical protein HC890_06800 [Chloroflexaceae bacterium]|nr:hypothetical protein [Chloroflexaceae bacterium]
MIPQIKPQYTVAWLENMAEIPQTAWDDLAQPLKTPFLEWEWLNNLETSGSVRAQTGWQPCHLSLWRDRDLIGAAPLYLKGHSYGEFVFDHQWADVAHRLGLSYYPKLLGMTPFTPAEGYRFLIAPTEDEALLTQLMVAAIDQFCTRNRLSGCNFLFVDPDWKPIIERHGFRSWQHHSYIWTNQGFNHFDDYLQVFNANQRRNIIGSINDGNFPPTTFSISLEGFYHQLCTGLCQKGSHHDHLWSILGLGRNDHHH